MLHPLFYREAAMLQITLPDGKQKQFPEGTTLEQIGRKWKKHYIEMHCRSADSR